MKRGGMKRKEIIIMIYYFVSLSFSLSVYLWTQAFTLVALLERLCTLFYTQYVSTCGFTHPYCEVVYTRRDDDE